MNQKKVSKKITALFAALAFMAPFSYNLSAQALVPASEMPDLSSNHWAYKAIQALVEKYRVMNGYPDKSFRGARTLNRYELAAALYKVMTKVEEMIARSNKQGTETEIDTDIFVTKQDLETIMALQREFKGEISNLYGKIDELADNIKGLGKVKINGMVELKFRDRVNVTDHTKTSSPLNGVTPDSDGGIKKFNSPLNNLITEFDVAPFRMKSSLNINAEILPGITYEGNIIMDDGTIFWLDKTNGEAVAGHFGNEGLGGNSLYLKDSFFSAKAKFEHEEGEEVNENGEQGVGLSFGFMNFKNVVNTGTKFRNRFNNEKWIGHGYGLVGFGSNDIAVKGKDIEVTKDGKTATITESNSVSRFWGSGLDVSRVDPDSHRYNDLSSPSFALDASLGPLTFIVAGNAGATYANRRRALLTNLGSFSTQGILSGADFINDDGGGLVNEKVIIGNKDPFFARTTNNLLDLPSEYGDGYGLISLDLDLGWLRANVSASDYWLDSTFSLSGTRKSISGVVDIGTNAFGLSLQTNYNAIGLDSYSAGLFANDFAGSGLDFGVGAKTAMRGLLNFGQMTGTNAGFYVSVPPIAGTTPRLTLATRQTFGDSFGSPKDINGVELSKVSLFKDSGLTLSANFLNFANSGVRLDVEYNVLVEGSIWGFNSMAHDLGIYTTYSF